jgi:hypothetical protein
MLNSFGRNRTCWILQKLVDDGQHVAHDKHGHGVLLVLGPAVVLRKPFRQ